MYNLPPKNLPKQLTDILERQFHMKNSLLVLITILMLAILNQSSLTAQEETPANEAAKADESFPLKEGDVWVMLGDSITAQHLHSNYFEAFCYARYPKLNFCFRNSGVGGDTITSAMARFEWDVASWKPTVVSVELGMNDKNASTVEKYIENMGKLNDKIKAIPARAVYFTASPINNGDNSENLGANTRLNEFADKLKIFANEQKAPYADQFHALLDVWGKNRPREVSATLKTAIEANVNLKNLPGSEHLKAYLAEIAKDTSPVISMMGDPVHPGAPGQLMMTAALLKALKAEGFVSSATIDATGKTVESKGCVIENGKVEKDVLTFTRLDDCLPFPIPTECRSVLPLCPSVMELSQYTLKVTGLTGAKYILKVNNILTVIISGQELEAGINLTSYTIGAIANQSKAILTAVNAKEIAVGAYRNQSKLAALPTATDEAKQKLETLKKNVEDADAKIRVVAKPIPLNFEIAPPKETVPAKPKEPVKEPAK